MSGQVNFTPSRVRGHCPNCGPARWADVVGHAKHREDDEESQTWYQTDHRILQCPACEGIYHQTVSVFSEDYIYVNGEYGQQVEFAESVSHWPEVPQIKKEKPNWINDLISIDITLYELINDIYSALNIGLSVFSVIGVRTLLDRATEVLGIDAAITFDEKLDELLSQDYIGQTEKGILAIATDAGSAAAHRGWKPSDKDLSLILEAVEAFLHRVFIMRANVSGLKSTIPPKPKRKTPRKKKTP
ncbi:DUF4145 domain-containing protein [Mesorhizobium sp. WSM3879]|uniref:DUF4145 domain-containing protein n=1 Tax=Mesorhizobium sp. WSM3879 TaxID=2029406 RepID=UPI001180EA0A|nr:DUF4145 domain-containing protein [Mesorhizobium sp. WSM3879]